MSEFLAAAQVIVSPNTSGFRNELLAQLKTATEKPVSVLVTPNTKGFATTLKAETKAAADATLVSVIVTPDMKTFRAQLEAESEAAAAGASVRVLVYPQLTGFASLRERVQAEAAALGAITVPVTPIITEATAAKARSKAPVAVPVTPDAKGFATKLKAELKAATEKPVGILVAPNMKGFAAKLAAEVKAAAAKVTANIPVVPVLGTFRAKLEAAVKAASKGVTAPVSVTPVVTPAKTAKAAADAAGSSAGKTARVKSAEQVAAAEVTAQERATAKMDEIHRRALAADIKFDKKAAESAEKTAAAEVAAQRKATADKLKLIESETAAIVQRAEANVASSLGNVQSSALAENRRRDLAAKAAKDEIRNTEKAQKKAFKTRLADISAENKALLGRGKTILGPRIEEEAALAAARDKAALATTRLTEAEAFRSLASGESARARQSLVVATAAVTAAEASFEASLLTSNRALQGQAVDAVLAARGLEVQRIAAVKAAIANTELASSQEFVRRGALATLLSMVGLRGATLAANASFIAGAAGAIVLAKSVQSAANLESELNVFRVTAGATADQMDRVSDSAARLGRDVTLPGVSANDAAEAMTELSKAGLDVQDSIDGARGVLQLATAAQIDNAEATTLAASALNAFGLAGSDAVHVADVLTNAANSAQGSISDMGLSLQQAAAVARQVGVSFEDTVALLTLLARNGIRGSDAGTSLRVAFTKLINPTKKAKEILTDLNVQLRDSAGNIRPEVFSEFAQAQQGLSRQQRDTNAAVVFGTDALRAYSIISREGIPALNATRDALQEQGSAAELAGARMEGLEGKAANLKNQVEALGLTIGQQLLPSLEVAADLLITITSTANSAASALEGVRDKLRSVPGGGFLAEIFLKNPVEQQLVAIENLGKGIDQIAGRSSRFKIILDTREAQEAARDVREELDGILSQFDKFPLLDRKVNLHQVLTQLDAMIVKLSNGDENAKKLANQIREVRRQVAERGLVLGFKVEPLKLPPELRPGGLNTIGTDMADAVGKAFTGELQNKWGSKSFGAGAFLADMMAKGIRSGKDGVGDAAKETASEAIKGFEGQQAGFEEGMLDVLLSGGTPKEQIANLRKQASAQQRIIDSAGKELTEKRRAAKAKLQQINSDIATIEDGIKADADKARADAKDRRDKAQQARDKADAAFLKSLGVRSDKLGLAEMNAQLNGNLKQQLKLAIARKRFIRDEISLIQENVHDQEQAAAEILKLRGEQLQADETIENLRAEISESISGKLEKKINLAELRGDKSAMMVLLKAAIAEARRAVKLAIEAKEGVLDAKIKLQDLRNQRQQMQQDARDAVTDKFAKRLQLAELRGDKDTILAALNAAIANARTNVAKAKQAKKGVLDAQIALAELQQQKQDFLDEAKDKGQGTTAFDLLTEAAEVFNQNAGDLIGTDQPFAGPTGFTADLAQFLKRKPGTQKIDITEKSAVRKDEAIVKLTSAIDRNTDALLGKKATTVVEKPGAAEIRRRRERFVQSMQAHEAQIAG